MAVDSSFNGQGEVIVEDETLAKGFTVLPNYILKNRQLCPGAKLTYVVLLSYAWTQDRCFPGQTTLAEDVGCTDRSIRTYLNELVADHLVIIKRQGLTKPNIYFLPRWKDGRPETNSDQERKPFPPRTEKFSGQERKPFPSKKDPDQEIQDQAYEDQRTPARSKSSPRRGSAKTGNGRQLWTAVLDHLQRQVSKANFDAWLRDSRLIRQEGSTAIIGVANGFTRDWISQHCVGLIGSALSDVLGRPVTVRVEVTS